jgi:superfamily II DNA or RNA helicase
MSDQRQPPDRLFSDQDRLLLQQLLTRRALLKRSESEATKEETADVGAEDSVVDQPTGVVPDRWRLTPKDAHLYDWQRECLPVWLKNGRGTVKVATGGGKTLFALAAAETLQNDRQPDLRLVVVVPSIPLMYQWYDEVLRGNLPASSIGLMGGGSNLQSLSGLRVLICVLNSARERLPALVRRADWPQRLMLVVDECHRSGASRARKIFDAGPRYALGLSATPERDVDATDVLPDSAYEDGVVGKALGPIIYDFSLQRSLEAGLLTPFEVWHVGLPLTPVEAIEHDRLSREISDLRKTLQMAHRKGRSKQGFLAWCQTQAARGGSRSAEAERFIGLANRRKRLLYRATARSESALGVLSESLADKETLGIVFHESIEEIEDLFLRALDRGIPAVLEHSKLPDSLRADNIEAFRQGVARVIVSAKSLVEGFNVPSADLGIIAASSSSVRQRIQSLGRMLRRKKGERVARVYVLYIRNTEDEAIYEKADWEDVVGAEQNRYFVWNPGEEGSAWSSGLVEEQCPPRAYLPPSTEIDISALSPGDQYPARSVGVDVKVDQGGNLRTDDDSLLRVPMELVDQLLGFNRYRRGRITPAGHLIARRSDVHGSGLATWVFIGSVGAEPVSVGTGTVRLKLKQVSGRRVIVGRSNRGSTMVPFALGPESALDPEAGKARNLLLDWVKKEEGKLGLQAHEICWDGRAAYWLELEGNRIDYPGDLPPLEFPQ